MQETDQSHPAPKTLGLSMAIVLTTLLLVAASDFLLFDAEWGINLFLASLIIASHRGALFRLVLLASRVD